MKNIFEAYKLFFMDLLRAISHYNFWLAYSAQDIKNKYTRSIIGPFWNTITIGLIILVVGPLYGMIFGNSGGDYYLHFGIGIIFWNFISSTISDSTLLFISESPYLKQTDLSPLIHIIRMISRNTIMFFHNLIVVILLYFLFNDFYFDSMLIFISFPLLIILLFLICFLCAIITLRFRDFGPLVSNITQLGLFLTPIFWVQSNDIRSVYLLLNPFNYMLDITRGCFNGQFKISSLLMIFLLILLLFNLSVFVYYKYRKRIVYWI